MLLLLIIGALLILPVRYHPDYPVCEAPNYIPERYNEKYQQMASLILG
jgi:hypothetical protein